MDAPKNTGRFRRKSSTIRRVSWGTVFILLASLFFISLGEMQGTFCASLSSNVGGRSGICPSDTFSFYQKRGFSEGVYPYDNSPKWRAPNALFPQGKYSATNQELLEYPTGMAYWLYGVDKLTQAVTGHGDLSSTARYRLTPQQLSFKPEITREANVWIHINEFTLILILWLAVALFLWPLTRGNRKAFYLFTFSPIVLFMQHLNWDDLAVACSLAFLWCENKKKHLWAGLAIGLGTALKLYPVLFLVPLFALALRERKWRPFLTTLASSTATWLVLNVPAYLQGAPEWRYFWSFNSNRLADDGSLWLYVIHYAHTGYSTSFINLVSELLVAAGLIGVVVLVKKVRITPELPELLLIVVGIFLLTNKVYSVQYSLWLLPFAALVFAHRAPKLFYLWSAGEVLLYFAKWQYAIPLYDGHTPEGWETSGYFTAILIHWLLTLTLMGHTALSIAHRGIEPSAASGCASQTAEAR